MLRAALEEKSKTHTIEAVVYAHNPMLKHYVNEFGFQIVGDIPNYRGTGALFYKLERAKLEAPSQQRAA